MSEQTYANLQEAISAHVLDEYGEEAAYEKYLTQQVYQEIIGNPQ